MKYISSLPSRLYCGTCEEVYYVPQKGTIKVILIIIAPFNAELVVMLKYIISILLAAINGHSAF